MANKKSFKESSQASVASMFMSPHQPVTDSIPEQGHQDIPYVPYVQNSSNPLESEQPKMTRMNLKIAKEYKDYLEYISWKNRTNMTQYLVGLIKADMERYEKVKYKKSQG